MDSHSFWKTKIPGEFLPAAKSGASPVILQDRGLSPVVFGQNDLLFRMENFQPIPWHFFGQDASFSRRPLPEDQGKPGGGFGGVIGCDFAWQTVFRWGGHSGMRRPHPWTFFPLASMLKGERERPPGNRDSRPGFFRRIGCRGTLRVFPAFLVPEPSGTGAIPIRDGSFAGH